MRTTNDLKNHTVWGKRIVNFAQTMQSSTQSSNVPLEKSFSVTGYLGVYINCQLTWHDHIDYQYVAK